MRGSIESRTGLPFPEVWAGMQDELINACPGKTKVCVGYALVAVPSADQTEDCIIVEGGIKVPDPLYEKGNITFRVNNKNNCTAG
jgi:hypothetical protein